MAEVVFLDTEYFFLDMSKDSGRPGPDTTVYLAQVAAVIYDTKAGAATSLFDELVKPDREVPEFFWELTGLTLGDMEAVGRPLDKVLEALEDWVGERPVYTFDRDWFVLDAHYDLVGLENPFPPFIRVKGLLPSVGLDPDSYSSGTLCEAAGLVVEGKVHNAAWDVRSMSAACDKLGLIKA